MLERKTAPHIAAKRRLMDYIKVVPAGASRRLPPEPVLAKELGLSVWAMKKALLLLEQEGRVVIVPRKGNFIASTPAAPRFAIVWRDVSAKSTCLGSLELLEGLFGVLKTKVGTINSVQTANHLEIPDLLESYNFDGVVFVGGFGLSDDFKAIASNTRIPYVAISDDAKYFDMPNCFSLDHEASGRLRAEFMVARGHRAIACMTARDGLAARGFCAAAAAHGFTAPLFEVTEIQRRLPRVLDGPATALILDGHIRPQTECFELIERHPRHAEIEVMIDYAGPMSLDLVKAHPKVNVVALNKVPLGEMGRAAGRALLERVEFGTPVEGGKFITVLIRPDGSGGSL